MSGHSKWSQIKHRKGISDQKKAQVFSKVSKKISIAARDGTDPVSNYRLQAIIEEARALNMPKENIERAIKRAGEKEATALNEVMIHAMGPGSIAMIIEAITDSKNRTINEIKNILSKNDSKMVPENSLNWMFDKNWNPITQVEVSDPAIQEKIDKLFEELDSNDDIENVHTNLK
jgi:YebC/PmpR family DNA-binding regulatory protein